jgi:thiamine kinase-like enzyme
MYNRDVQTMREKMQYQASAGLACTVGEEVGQVLSEVGRLHDLYCSTGQAWSQQGICMVHGDMWPRSMLICGPDSLACIDWEFSTWGWPGQDVGHLAAHLWMAGHAWAGGVEGEQFAQPQCDTDVYTALDKLMWEQWSRAHADAQSQHNVVHWSAEILARLGPWRAAYVYEGASTDDAVVGQAWRAAMAVLQSRGT